MKDFENICPRIPWSRVIRLFWETDRHIWVPASREGIWMQVSRISDKCFRLMCQPPSEGQCGTTCSSHACGKRKALGAPRGQDSQAGRKQSISLVIPAKPQHALGFGSAKNLGSFDKEWKSLSGLYTSKLLLPSRAAAATPRASPATTQPGPSSPEPWPTMAMHAQGPDTAHLPWKYATPNDRLGLYLAGRDHSSLQVQSVVLGPPCF